ncbi:YCF48-related protein [Pseudomonas sp. NBRC 100443]|uniref:WD40/YVTN/BNR-like repeat-containing protein n=1 Tax=Pseudomonas sp. NBRC 100443 TaxID=1113665 RepID=UPI002553C713|nr:YCF48-related protein [Pseudomonas sp. NBRC 100443]
MSFVDPLDVAAISVQNVGAKPVAAVVLAGSRLVAVGMRGIILFSDDQGSTWSQAQVPVQSDLTAVYFVDAKIGWAVGHDGMILRSEDAGVHWQRQLDGRAAAENFKSFYQRRSAAGEQGLDRWLAEIERNYGSGPGLPYLDVLFEDARHGYAVGSFGTLSVTSDGGATWQPGYELIDNPNLLNLNAIRRIGEQVYIAGEQGSVFRLNRSSQRFERLDSGYTGSFFGLVGKGDRLLAFGLRGAAYLSQDAGQHWIPVNVGEQALLSAGTLLPDGRVALASIAGRFWTSSPDWSSFTPQMAPRPAILTGIASLQGRLVLSSLAGMQAQGVGEISAPKQ